MPGDDMVIWSLLPLVTKFTTSGKNFGNVGKTWLCLPAYLLISNVPRLRRKRVEVGTVLADCSIAEGWPPNRPVNRVLGVSWH